MDLPLVRRKASWGIARVSFGAGHYVHGPAGRLELRVVRRGSSTADIDLGAGARRVFTRPGDLLLSLPDRATMFRIDDRRELSVVQIAPDEAVDLVIATGGAGLEDLAPLMQKPFRDTLVAGLCRQLETRPTEAIFRMTLGVILAQLLVRAKALREVASPPVLSPKRYAAVLALIDARIDSGLTIDDLAAQAEIPRRLFARAFRAASGLPAYQYILRRRFDAAVTLLESSDLSIADVALRTGFAHQAHMSRMLKSLKGRTPLQLRREKSATPDV